MNNHPSNQNINKNRVPQNQNNTMENKSGSTVVHLETLKMKFQMLLNTYSQVQSNYYQYLSEHTPGNSVMNPNFDDPTITNNSYLYLTSAITIPNWNLTDSSGNSTDDSSNQICGNAGENGTAVLTCPTDQVITSIDFASYGLPTGSCGSYSLGSSCNATSSQSVVEAACLNNNSCSIGANNGVFGDPCPGIVKSLSIQAKCGVPKTASSSGGGVILMNKSTDWGYPTPYPKGSQAMSLQNIGSISQTLNLNAGTYHLSFMACGRSSGSNPINIVLNGAIIYNVEPEINTWKKYKTAFTVDTTGSQTITFAGTTEDGDLSSAIQNITVLFDDLTSIKGTSFLGQNISVSQVEDVQECIASCSSLSECKGATYNDEQKMCSLQSGEGNILPSANSNNYAIISSNLMYLHTIEQLNQQLMNTNNEIAEIISENEPVYIKSAMDLKNNSQQLDDHYKNLMKERIAVKSLIREFEKLESVKNDSSLDASSNYSIFIFLLIISLILVILFVMIFFFSSKNTGTTTSTTSSLLQKGGFYSNYFSSNFFSF